MSQDRKTLLLARLYRKAQNGETITPREIEELGHAVGVPEVADYLYEVDDAEALAQVAALEAVNRQII